MPTDKPITAATKIATLYRTRKHLHSIAIIERNHETRGGQFPIPKLYQLTQIHDAVADGVWWFDDESAARRFATELGYTHEEAMPTKLITIDTDNAVIRLYLDNAKEYGLTPAVIARLRYDLATLAIGVSSVSGATFRFEVV